MSQELYETVIRQEEYEEDMKRRNKEMDDFEFLSIINRRIKDKRRRNLLLTTYFGDDYDGQNFGDC